MTASSSCTKQGKLGTEQMRAVAIKDVVVHLKNVKGIEGTLCCMQPPQSCTVSSALHSSLPLSPF